MLPLQNMVIIKHFRLKRNKDSDFFYVRCLEEPHCPWCEGCFQVIGSRTRILCRQDGSVIHLVIRRLKCLKCGKISHELPDIVVPYKRHETDSIAQALAEPTSAKQNRCCCENTTIRRYRLWFFLLCNYLEGSVRAILEKMQCPAFVKLPLYPLERQADGWLGTLVRNVVNSGRWLQTRSA